MNVQFDYLRPEKAKDFSWEKFRDEIEEQISFDDQLHLFDEYFDLLAMGRTITISGNGERHYTLYDENDGDSSDSVIGQILTAWRRSRFLPLKKQFDALETYEERINFSLNHFKTALCTYVPEQGIEFSTIPNTPEEQRLYNMISYRNMESGWLANPYTKDKSFESRKKAFEARIVNTLHPEEELEREMLKVRQEYEHPAKTWPEGSDHFNVHIITFRERLRGYMLNDTFENGSRFLTLTTVFKMIEGQHAYEYYEYLFRLNSNPRWLNEIRLVKTQLIIDPVIFNVNKSDLQPQLLFIKPGSRVALYQELKDFVECDSQGESQDLRALIFDNKPPSSPIVITGKIEDFGQAFYENDAIADQGAATLSEQLATYFLRNDGEKIMQLKPSYLVKCLRKSKAKARVAKGI